MIEIKTISGAAIWRSNRTLSTTEALLLAHSQGISFQSADFKGSDLSGLVCRNGYFYAADFTGANLKGTRFVDCAFDRALLTRANCTNAIFIRCTFDRTNTEGSKSEGVGFYPSGPGTVFSKYTKFVHWLHWAKAYSKQHGEVALKEAWENLKAGHIWLECCPTCFLPAIKSLRLAGNGFNREGGQICRACNQCIGCCECYFCGVCRNYRQESLCNDCDACSSCCGCVHCSSCGDLVDEICSNCGRGNGEHSCCRCGPRMRHFVNEVYFWDSSKNKLKLKQNSSKRFVAAEIEVASIASNSVNIKNAINKWSGSVVRDGSLPEGGFEINTSPANGDYFIEQIKEICAVLVQGGGSVDKTCGLHVHIDARDYKYYDIRRLVKVYAILEDTLFQMCSNSRRTSHYCAPCGSRFALAIENGKLPYDKVKKDVTKAVYLQEDTREKRTAKYNDARYAALNLHSWFYRGTIECRMFNGTISSNKIINWGILWCTLLDYVNRSTDESVVSDMLMFPSDPLNYLNFIMGDQTKVKEFIKARIEKFKLNPNDEQEE